MVVQGYQFLAYEWAWFGVITILVWLRLYIRVYLHGSVFKLDTWRWSDRFLLIPWILRLTICTMDSVENAWDGYNLQPVNTPPHEVVMRNKMYIFGFLLYMLVFVFVKFTMLCLFSEFVPKVLIKTWWYIRIIATLVTLHAIGSIIVLLTNCNPISGYWSGPPPKCILYERTITFWFVGHLLTEILIISIPFCLIHLLRNLSVSQRIVATAMFSLGFVTIVCTVGNSAIGILLRKTNRGPPTVTELTAFGFLAITEGPTAIAIACLPPLRLLFTRKGRANLFGTNTRGETVEVAHEMGSVMEVSGATTLTKNDPDDKVTKVSTEKSQEDV